MMDIGWLVFLGLVAAGSLGTAMAISGRYEAVVFSITAGFFFTLLSLTVLAGEDWGVKQEIEHEYYYTPGRVAPVTIAEDFSKNTVGDSWEIRSNTGGGSVDTGGTTMFTKYNNNKLQFWQTEQAGFQYEIASKVFEADGDITRIVIHGDATKIGHDPSMTIRAYNEESGSSREIKVVPTWIIDTGSRNSAIEWIITIPETVPTKAVRIDLSYWYSVVSGGTVSQAKLFQISGIDVTSYPAPTAKIESITETHGTVWLSQWPQIQQFMATFLGLIGLWAFFYSITCMFQFGPGRAKK